jgi:hypothetical protein
MRLTQGARSATLGCVMQRFQRNNQRQKTSSEKSLKNCHARAIRGEEEQQPPNVKEKTMSTAIRKGTSPMRYKCSRCSHVIVTDPESLPTECPGCQMRLKPARALPIMQPLPPIIVQVPTDPFDFIEEKKADLRERREAREESRRYHREDRQSNFTGIAGFAMNVTVLLVLLSGWMFAKSLPAYLYITASLAVPVSIAGLVLCIVASLTPSRQRLFALTGAGIGALLVLFLLPLSFLLREMLGK